MTNQLIPIILNLIASVFGAYGQWLYKIGALRLTDQPIWKNYPFLGGMACFTAVMLLFMAGFRLGGRISVTFPIYALTFVWGTLIGVFIDKEPFNTAQAVGVGLVFVGVAIVGALAPR
ncbi:MAG: hypothetical protein K2P81_05495 [Bacteriovoracaceae bacterium]|nr:hypothetical protein [Bacteriovoracaceae bacterium]